MIFETLKPKELTYGTIVSVGARKVTIALKDGRQIIATVDGDMQDKVKIGYTAVVGHVGKGNSTAYVVYASLDVLDKHDQEILVL